MKKLFIIGLLLIPVLLFADVDTKDGVAITEDTDMDGFTGTINTCDGQTVVAGGSCPANTYMFYWDGDHGSGTTEGCYNSGASSTTGTANGMALSTDYGESGSIGAQINADDDELEFTLALANWLNDEAWTICMRLYKSASTTENAAFETCGDNCGQDYIVLYIRDDDAPRLSMEYQNVGIGGNLGSEALTMSTWETICWAYDYVDGVNDEWNILNCGNDDDCSNDAWGTDQTGAHAQGFGTNPTTFRIGEKDKGITQGGDEIWVDKIVTLNGFKQDPTSWW